MPNNLEVKTLTQKTDVDPITDLVVAHDTVEEEAVLIAPRDAHKALGDRYSFGGLSIDDYESDDDKKQQYRRHLRTTTSGPFASAKASGR